MSTIKGIRTDSGCIVTIGGHPLHHEVYHSPTGFEWGYLGSGPADLARSILLAVGTPKELADSIYQDFKREIISALPHEGWQMTVESVTDWVLQYRIEGAAR